MTDETNATPVPAKPKLPAGFGGATKGTRRGNGAGHGGPAKGAGRVIPKGADFEPGNKVANRPPTPR